MRYRNRYNVNLLANPLKNDPALLARKNELESKWYDREAELYFAQLSKTGELIAMDADYESWFGYYYDNPDTIAGYDRNSRFFGLLSQKHDPHVLDLGCGDGCLSRFLLRRGKHVVSVDISIKVCRFLRESDSRSQPIKACGEILPFKDESFDIVTSQAALHHLNADLGLAEIKRVLKPDGLAVFLEPLYNSKMLYKVRQLIPIDDNESPGGGGFRKKELISILNKHGLNYCIEEFELFTRLERLMPSPKIQTRLKKLDRRILKHFPLLNYFARTIVLSFRK
jgi:SAM-dependent methyltransferase